MSDYINFEAEAEFIEGDEVSDFFDNGSEDSFINDNDQNVNTDVSFHRGFTNVENDIEQVLKESYEESLEDLDNFDEISNLCYGSEEENLKLMISKILKLISRNLKKLYFQGLTLKFKKFKIKFAIQYYLL